LKYLRISFKELAEDENGELKPIWTKLSGLFAFYFMEGLELDGEYSGNSLGFDFVEKTKKWLLQ
jgi:hypothetical protein